MHGKAEANVNRAAVDGPVRRCSEEKTVKSIDAELLGLACLLVVSLGLGAGLGIAAIFDVDA